MLRNFPVKTAAFCVFSAIFTLYADTLSIKSFVGLVLKNNPQPKIGESAVLSSIAAREKARSNLLPSINGNAGLSRSNGSMTNSSGNSLSTGISGSLLLFDFGATPLQFRASGKSLDAARNDFESTIQSTILSARTTYLNYLVSVQLLSVNQDALSQAEQHYDQARVLVEVGKLAQIAVTKANVDVANARVNLIHSENAVKLARVQLETVAGIRLNDPLELTDSLNSREDSISLDTALARAQKNRPELLAALARQEAARMQLRAARASYLPSLNASAGYSWRVSSPNSIPSPAWNQPNWNVGAGLSVPLFEGGATRAAVHSAEASLKKSDALLEQTRLSIAQQVEQHIYEETNARERITATDVLINQASESLRMSQEQYRAGVATSIEITDAEVTLANARISHVQAQYDYRVARLNILVAIGALHE